jgi:hypothetical protein
MAERGASSGTKQHCRAFGTSANPDVREQVEINGLMYFIPSSILLNR